MLLFSIQQFLGKALLMNTTICFCGVLIRKIFTWYPVLSRPMISCDWLHKQSSLALDKALFFFSTKRYHIYPKYSDTSTPYHTCSKIWTSTIYYQMLCLNIPGWTLQRLIWVYTVCSGLSVQGPKVNTVLIFFFLFFHKNMHTLRHGTSDERPYCFPGEMRIYIRKLSY